MADERFDLSRVDFRELFPWLHLFRGFRLALDFKKMALGALGAFATAAGWWVITFLFGADGSEPLTPPAPVPAAAAAEQQPGVETPTPAEQELPEQLAAYQAMAEARRFPWEPESGIDVFRSPLQPDGWTANNLPAASHLVLYPVRRLIFPARLMFRDVSTTFLGVLLALWSLVVWAFFGGAITRIAAVQVAREGHVGLGEAIRFVLARTPNYLAAPLLPFLAVVVIVAFCAIGGLITWIPGLNVLMGAFWFLALLAGWIVTIVLVGLAVGWPLMYAAISAEATESFDAISRVYSYILGRAWNYLFYAVVSICFGAILTTLVVMFAFMTMHLSQYAVSWGASSDAIRTFYSAAPAAGGWREAFGSGAAQATPGLTDRITSLFVGFWTHLLFMGIVGFAYSYFWSSSTVIYFLLRKDVDETELEEVFLDEEEEEPFPTVAPTLGPPPETSRSKSGDGSSEISRAGE